MTTQPTIAYFISYHGFGHATRAAAVMAALERRLPQVRFELFTDCPLTLIKDSIQSEFGSMKIASDVGVVQKSPVEEDFAATIFKLSKWAPFDPMLVGRIVDRLKACRCDLVVCDISPLGIAAAKGAGIPSVLIENFTWDFIYEPELEQYPGLEMFAYYLKNVFSQADLHIQTEPLCRPVDGAVCVAPIARNPRSSREKTRSRLGIPIDAKMVVVSMGGVPDRFQFLEHLPAAIDPYIVIPSADKLSVTHEKIILLPTNSDFFHPDLLQAADLLIGKAGYSTVAEAYHARVPYGYLLRPQSPESPALEDFIQQHLSSHPVTIEDYNEGRWFDMLPELLALAQSLQPAENGADQVARLLADTYF